jgi:hypothetical protein
MSQMFRTAIIITHFLMLLLQSNGIFNCFLNSFKFLTLRPVAERIKKLSIKYNIEPEPDENDAGFNSEKWLAFINYVLCVSPNLELLKIHVINQTSFGLIQLSFDSRIERISKSISGVVEQVTIF